MPPRTHPPLRVRTAEPPETVDPKWLLKAFSLVVAIAFLLGYATLCLLFYQGQWQLVLHPGKPPNGTPAQDAQTVHFGPDATAVPQLTGRWVPAAKDGPYRQFTFLYLRGADGSLADDPDDPAALATLHAAGLNLLAFDYRGYPVTPGRHPTEARMTEDAEAAWQYLVADRHIAPETILPYGIGVGASLAVHLASEHREIQALILDTPTGDLLDRALSSPQGSLLPVRLLFHERFPLADPVSKLSTPKLILSRGAVQASSAREAADPKFTVDLPPGSPPSAFQSTLNRFLDQYLPPAPVPRTDQGTTPAKRLLREPLK